MKKPPQYCVDCKRHKRGNTPKMDVCKKDKRLCILKRAGKGVATGFKCRDFK